MSTLWPGHLVKFGERTGGKVGIGTERGISCMEVFKLYKSQCLLWDSAILLLAIKN